MTHPSQESEMPEHDPDHPFPDSCAHPSHDEAWAELSKLSRAEQLQALIEGARKVRGRLAHVTLADYEVILATLDAAREQAATEARRELLAKVEGLESWDFGSTGGEFYVRLDDVVTLLGGTVRD